MMNLIFKFLMGLTQYPGKHWRLPIYKILEKDPKLKSPYVR